MSAPEPGGKDESFMDALRASLARADFLLFAALEKPFLRYFTALVLFALALALRLAIFPLAAGYAFFTFYPAVILSALLCGTGPALMGIALSSVVIDYMLIPPAWTISFTPEAIGSIAVYAVSSALFCLMIRKSREGETERSLLAAIVRSADIAIVSKNLHGVVTSWNPEAEHLFGYSAAESVGKPMNTLYPPDHMDEEARLLARIAAGESIQAYETVRIRKDGSQIHVSVTKSPIRDRFGRVVGASMVDHDITRRRELEAGLRHSNQRLNTLVAELLDRNRELDEFAYIASHDLKEPLRGIHNYVSFLQEDYAALLDDEGRKYLARMQHLAQRMTALIDGLLAYSRLGSTPLAMAPVPLDAILDGVAEDLQPTLQALGVELRRAGPLPTVTGSALRLGEVFQNLIANAAKYNDKPGKWVEVGCDLTGAVPVFYVRDNGIGIPPQHRERVFRIFKRLHEQSRFGGGTGAGLTIVRKIVQRHGGRIWLESTEGEGTTFFFTLSAGGI